MLAADIGSLAHTFWQRSYVAAIVSERAAPIKDTADISTSSRTQARRSLAAQLQQAAHRYALPLDLHVDAAGALDSLPEDLALALCSLHPTLLQPTVPLNTRGHLIQLTSATVTAAYLQSANAVYSFDAGGRLLVQITPGQQAHTAQRLQHALVLEACGGHKGRSITLRTQDGRSLGDEDGDVLVSYVDFAKHMPPRMQLSEVHVVLDRPDQTFPLLAALLVQLLHAARSTAQLLHVQVWPDGEAMVRSACGGIEALSRVRFVNPRHLELSEHSPRSAEFIEHWHMLKDVSSVLQVPRLSLQTSNLLATAGMLWHAASSITHLHIDCYAFDGLRPVLPSDAQDVTQLDLSSLLYLELTAAKSVHLTFAHRLLAPHLKTLKLVSARAEFSMDIKLMEGLRCFKSVREMDLSSCENGADQKQMWFMAALPRMPWLTKLMLPNLQAMPTSQLLGYHEWFGRLMSLKRVSSMDPGSFQLAGGGCKVLTDVLKELPLLSELCLAHVIGLDMDVAGELLEALHTLPSLKVLEVASDVQPDVMSLAASHLPGVTVKQVTPYVVARTERGRRMVDGRK